MIDRAVIITGYMSPLELIQLGEWAAEHKLIVEIGSYFGRSTRAMADSTSGVIHAIDDFNGLREFPTNPSQEEIRSGFKNNLADCLASGRVVIHERPHEDPPEIDCDMCFIDGSHHFDAVVRDILFWRRFTKGLMCGHDFASSHHDVQKAVDYLLPGYRVIPGTTLWWINL